MMNNNFYNNIPTQCVIENGNIMQVDFYGNKSKIGVTNDVYAELEKISGEYYNKLVEMGAIVPPKTPEQMQEENLQLMSEMMNQIKTMKAELEVLKNDKSAKPSADDAIKPARHSET